MRYPGPGDRVFVNFIARLDDGTTIEESAEDAPVEAVIGAGTINPAFDEALRGMAEGESRTVTLPPEKAYGKYNKRLVFRIRRKKLDIKCDPEPGDLVRVGLPDGRKAPVTVISIDAKNVTVDANHPHAGETIHYTLTLVRMIPDTEA
jgi:FKBP-type peptidyl-prolyl cis-trans isomerase 2